MDFGIALALTEEQRLTRTNTSMGTPDYMSPEQITRPLEVDFRSDIYSFGCVLYAMLSGNPPFSSEGATAFAIHDRHVRAAPPPLVYRNPEIPRTVNNVVLKCLQKDPANRYQTCGEIIPALNEALDGKGESTSGGFTKYAIAGLVVIVLILAAGYFLKPHKIDPEMQKILSTKWEDVPSTYVFGDCRDYKPCQDKKDRAGNLSKIKNWTDIHYDDPVLKDCMKLQPCFDRKAQAEKLAAITDWKKVTDKKLLSDCMSYLPCQQRHGETSAVVSIFAKSCAYVADNVDCCELTDPAQQAYCSDCKKKEKVTGGECGGNYQRPKLR
jgi:hypothetical protein